MEGDHEGLENVIKHLINVRDHQEEYNTMFEPLSETLNLLKVYGVKIPKNIYNLKQVKSYVTILLIIRMRVQSNTIYLK